MIDPDGAGTGEQPFLVMCSMSVETRSAATIVRHDSMQRTLVDGYEEPGAYNRTVTYVAPMSQIEALVSVSSRCSQLIRFECIHARLLEGGYGWWVSRDGQRMDYWGGASPGSGSCACGIKSTCFLKGATCNCISFNNRLIYDEGYLQDKSSLPVLRMHFGDTGETNLFDKRGYHTLGEFVCLD